LKLSSICQTVIVLLLTLQALVSTKARAGVSPTGSFETSIPLDLPPGINGARPNLSLDYDSNAANGILGIGWSLGGLPVLARVLGAQGISYRPSDSYTDVDGPLVTSQDAHGVDEVAYRNTHENWNQYRAILGG
jgi:hypothetical protein